MNTPLQVFELKGTEADLSRTFLPDLLGNVFHFTTTKNWNLIKDSGHLATNKDGRFKCTSAHSLNSVGHFLDAICLFDFRQKGKEVLFESSIFFDFLTRRWKKDPVYFLVLAPSCYSAVTVQEELDEFTRSQKMYIPAIESWYKGDLPLINLERIYRVEILHEP